MHARFEREWSNAMNKVFQSGEIEPYIDITLFTEILDQMMFLKT